MLFFVLAAGVTATELTADIQPFPGYYGRLAAPTGRVTVNGAGESLNIEWQLDGLEEDAAGAVEIYTGSDCGNPMTVGHNFFDASKTEDHANAWHSASRYKSDQTGFAQGQVPSLYSGYGVQQNVGRVVVVKNSRGQGVGCGVLRDMQAEQLALEEAQRAEQRAAEEAREIAEAEEKLAAALEEAERAAPAQQEPVSTPAFPAPQREERRAPAQWMTPYAAGLLTSAVPLAAYATSSWLGVF